MVMAIIAIMSAIAVPRLGRSLARYRADSAAGRVAADLDYARTWAESRSAGQQVTFDVAADSYLLVAVADLDHPSSGYEVQLREAPYAATLESVDFGGNAFVVFDGYGAPGSGGTVSVKVGDVQRTVTLNAETGEATVQ